MANMEGVAVGTEVLHFATYNRRTPDGDPYIVTRVARKLLYAVPKSQYLRGEGVYREIAFRIENGVINDNYGHSHLETYEQREATQLRTRLLKEMEELGLELASYAPSKTDRITTDALVQIIKILRNLEKAI